MQQRTGNGVLDGQHANGGGVLFDGGKHLLKRRAANQLHLVTFEVEMGGDVVERPYQTLYCNLSHILYIMYKPRSFERGYIVILYVSVT